MGFIIDIRPRRQATFPSQLLQTLGVTVGDSVEITVEGQKAILKPKKRIALSAFEEIQKAFRSSGISEEELQKELLKDRELSK